MAFQNMLDLLASIVIACTYFSCSSATSVRSQATNDLLLDVARSTAVVDRCSRLAQQAIEATPNVTRIRENFDSESNRYARTFANASDVYPPANYNEFVYAADNFGPYNTSTYTRDLGRYSMRVWYPILPEGDHATHGLIPILTMLHPAQVSLLMKFVRTVVSNVRIILKRHPSCLFRHILLKIMFPPLDR